MKIFTFDAFNMNEKEKEEKKEEKGFTCTMCEKECEKSDLQTVAEDAQEPICKECAEKCDIVSNCCQAPFAEPGWPDNDICGSCGEHAGADLMPANERKPLKKKLFGGHKVDPDKKDDDK